MRISLVRRAASACVAATLAFSFSLAPSSARMGGPAGRPVFGPGHLSHFAPRGLNRRFDFDRFGFNRFGSDRFNRFGFNRFGFNRFGFNRFGGNQLALGGWGWGGWSGNDWGWGDWGGAPVSTGASEPIIVGGGAPVIINVGADPPSGGAGYAGGCVIHKLIYDHDGKYVGERQSPQC
jgi:hypothetical protein